MTEPSGIWILVAAGVGLGVATIAYAANRKRRAAYEAYCATRGYQYTPKCDDYHRAYADIVELFTKLSGRSADRISGIMARVPFDAFAYGYQAGKHRRWIAVMHWEGAASGLPRFSLAPEGFWQRIGQAFGAQDIDFPEDPGFSGAYQLQGPDEAAIRALFTPPVRYFFGTHRDQYVAASGKHLFWWRPGSLPSADDLDQFLMEGDRVRRAFDRT